MPNLNLSRFIVLPNIEIISMKSENRFYHITHLIEDAKNQGKKVGVFPIDDDAWIDIGEWAEYRQAVERF